MYTFEKYKNDVKEIISRKLITVFPCEGREQSDFVTSLMLDNTEKEIFIFSDSINDNKSDLFNKSLENYMDKDGKISFLLDNIPDDNSILYNKISMYLSLNPENGDIRQVTDSAKIILTESFKDNKYTHFIVSDDNRYKVEINNDVDFLCSFDHPKVAKKLKDIFRQASPLSLSKLSILNGI